jgi:hypothetical protein
LSLGQLFFVLRLLIQDAHLLARRRQMRRKFFLATKSVAARVGFNLGSV